MASEAPIQFVCTVAQVRTLADGGIRVTLDLPEDAIAEAAQLMQTRQAEGVMTVECWPGEMPKTRTRTR